jgi:hypothetical protein
MWTAFSNPSSPKKVNQTENRDRTTCSRRTDTNGGSSSSSSSSSSSKQQQRNPSSCRKPQAIERPNASHAHPLNTSLEVSDTPQGRQARPLLLPLSEDLRNASIDASAVEAFAVSSSLIAFLLRGRSQHVRQIPDSLSAHDSFLVVILDIDVDDMHQPVERRVAVGKICSYQHQEEALRNGERHTVQHSIPTALLTRDNDVDDALLDTVSDASTDSSIRLQAGDANFPVLPALGTGLDVAVAVEHVQQTVGGVEALIFRFQLLEHLIVGGAVKAVDVGFVDAGTGQPHRATRAKRDYGVFRQREHEVRFH